MLITVHGIEFNRIHVQETEIRSVLVVLGSQEFHNEFFVFQM